MNPGTAAYISLRVQQQMQQSKSAASSPLLNSLSITSFKPKHRVFLDRDQEEESKPEGIDPMLRMFLQDKQGRERAQQKLLKELRKHDRMASD